MLGITTDANSLKKLKLKKENLLEIALTVFVVNFSSYSLWTMHFLRTMLCLKQQLQSETKLPLADIN